MSLPPSTVHSLPANIDADGTTLKLPEEFVTAGVSSGDSETVYTSHFRGKKLYGKVFSTPADSEVLIVQSNDTPSPEEVPSALRVVGGPVEKLAPIRPYLVGVECIPPPMTLKIVIQTR
ncbi:hypothetical protein TcWFU_004962 [Taenia crassiceps]|uniref:Uncharacterized protein n=1 Tax=Taenia crassiceps TaxID=6207 RepID=A0ABR4QH56_9CEST